jgi:DNA-binding NtrC family response regulator
MQAPDRDAELLDEILGREAVAHGLREEVRQAAISDAPILIIGEQGTGRVWLASAIHRLSGRAHAPFIGVSLTSLPEGLAETSLLGCVGGVYTGFTKTEVGYLSKANGGTLFVDAIDEVPPTVQRMLVDPIEKGVFSAVGGVRQSHANVRLIASGLPEVLESGGAVLEFAKRSGGAILHLRPLRFRTAELAGLCELMLRKSSSSKHMTADALRALKRHPFPGNLRGLRNRIGGAVILGESEEISPENPGLEPSV